MTAVQARQLSLYAGPAAWTAPKMRARDDWIVELTADNVRELRAAAAETARRGLEIADIARSDFPLPRLGSKLSGLQQDVVHGRGFVLIRGLPVAAMRREESARV